MIYQNKERFLNKQTTVNISIYHEDVKKILAVFKDACLNMYVCMYNIDSFKKRICLAPLQWYDSEALPTPEHGQLKLSYAEKASKK